MKLTFWSYNECLFQAWTTKMQKWDAIVLIASKSPISKKGPKKSEGHNSKTY